MKIYANWNVYNKKLIFWCQRSIWTIFGRYYIRDRNCLPFVSTWVLPRFFVGSMLLFFLVFCVLFVLVLFLVWPIINVVSFSGILIAPSVFSNLYYQSIVARKISTKYFCCRYLKKKHCNIDRVQIKTTTDQQVNFFLHQIYRSEPIPKN